MAHAQPAPAPDQATLDQARVRFDHGRELQRDAHYDEAAAEYLAAFALDPAPAFLFDVAQVDRLAGHTRAALAYYRRFLALEPDGDGSADAREFVAALERALAAEPTAGPTRRDQPPARGDAADASARPIAPIFVRAPAVTAGRSKRLVGLGAGTLGLVALAVGIYYGTHARDLADELSAHQGPWGPADAARYAEGQAAERRMLGLSVAGGSALLAGALLYAWGLHDQHRAEDELELGAAPSAAGAVVTLAGRF